MFKGVTVLCSLDTAACTILCNISSSHVTCYKKKFALVTKSILNNKKTCTKFFKFILAFFPSTATNNFSPLNIFGTDSSPNISCKISIKHSCNFLII